MCVFLYFILKRSTTEMTANLIYKTNVLYRYWHHCHWLEKISFLISVFLQPLSFLLSSSTSVFLCPFMWYMAERAKSTSSYAIQPNAFALFSNNSHKYECDQRCPCLCDVLLILPQRCLLYNRILAHLLPSVKCVETVWFITTDVLWCHWRTWKRHLKGIYLASLLFCLPFSWKKGPGAFVSTSLILFLQFSLLNAPLLCQGNHYCFGEYFIHFNTSPLIHLTNTASHPPTSSANK